MKSVLLACLAALCLPLVGCTPAQSVATAPAAPVTAESVQVGLILLHDENASYDVAHMSGMEDALTNLGIDQSQLTYRFNTPEDENCYEAAMDLAESGCDIIFSNSFGHQTYLAQAAAEMPQVVFVPATGDNAQSSGLDNLKNIAPKSYESHYATGVVAGLKLQQMLDEGTAAQPHVGFVGAFPYAEVVSAYTGYYLGVKSVVPQATMDVIYTNSWYDPPGETQAANSLLGRGCAVIGQMSDSTAIPAAVQAAFEQGTQAYVVGHSIDMQAVAPDVALTSVENRWGALYEATLADFLTAEGDIPSDRALGYADGGVNITELTAACAPGTQEAVEAVWDGLEDGTLNIFDCANFTVGGEHLTSYTQAFGLEGQETIVDGVFQESTLRAAAYFDLRIDGITEHNG